MRQGIKNGYPEFQSIFYDGYLKNHIIASFSVYGSNKKILYSTDNKVDSPVKFYAATKKSNELLVYAFSKSTTSRPRVFDFLGFAVLLAARTWHTLVSLLSCAKVTVFKSSAMATASRTLLISTILLRVLSG